MGAWHDTKAKLDGQDYTEYHRTGAVYVMTMVFPGVGDVIIVSLHPLWWNEVIMGNARG